MVNLRNSPFKIKVFSGIILCCMILRYLSLIVLYLAQNIRYLYYLKSVLFISLIGIPLLYLLCIFIFTRTNKIKFDYSFIFMALLFLIYIYIMIKSEMIIQISNPLGYVASMINEGYICYGYVILISILMCVVIINLNKANINKFGMWLIFISLMLTVLENIFYLFGVELLVNRIVSELACILSVNFALNTFKKAKN